MRRFAILISLVGIVCVAGGAAQSPNPFGIPTADQPTPAAAIDAVSGSRAQGWLAQGRSEVLARHGIVATSDPLAAQAGVEILRQGGNAIDAAVAAGAVLDVTSQNDTGIGGDLFALVWSAREKKLYALNSGGWAPAAWTPQFFTERLGAKSVPGAGVNSATVPGAISGYDALLKRFGSMTFEQTFERAARIAEEGWGQAERRHADLRSATTGLRADADSRQTFLIDDHAPGLYSIIRNPTLAKALRLLQKQGRDAFYRGDIAAAIVAKVQANGGVMTKDDLAEFQSEWVEPISTTYHGYDVYVAASRAGICGAADAEYSRRVRTQAGREPREAGSIRSDVLAPDGRSQETHGPRISTRTTAIRSLPQCRSTSSYRNRTRRRSATGSM